MNNFLILTAITLLPLLGFLINGLFGNLFVKKYGEISVGIIACALPIFSFILTVIAFVNMPEGGISENMFLWASIAGFDFPVNLYFDKLSGLMGLIVTGVGSLIHIYSVGYMHSDKSFARFFAYLNLFLFFMLLLVFGQSLLILFVGWEGVGLVSYLLIGFWHQNSEFAEAGKKAFVVNRIGDAGFLIGMFILFVFFGTLDIPTINAAYTNNSTLVAPAITALIALMLFIGATGKSAQIPLYTWLPDAMAGPTPVSALIHAATMVTAGVYMLVRMAPLYLSAVEIMNLIAIIGALTSLLAASIALTQTDIKKVLAYSTVSQLGLMFTAVGVGAFGVAIFHVFTHAFFKACLFLGAGSVIHAMSGEQDIMKMGGLWKKIPITFFTFLIATAAISGLPPLAGFFSKDEILIAAFASDVLAPFGGGGWWLWLIVSIASLMTSFYMFRLLWLTFFGKTRFDSNVEKHIHESPNSMIFVLIILAFFSIIAGFIHVPEFLGFPLSIHEALVPYETQFVLIATGSAILGIIVAILIYFKDLAIAEKIKNTFPELHTLSKGKFFVDEFYTLTLLNPYKFLSQLCKDVLESFFDLALRGSASFAKLGAFSLAKVQNGNIQFYLLLALAGILFLIVWSILG